MSREITCFDVSCKESFVSIDALRLHLFFKHRNATSFKCTFNSNCFRIFSTWDSYSKDLVHKHEFPLHYDPTTNVINRNVILMFSDKINDVENRASDSSVLDCSDVIEDVDFQTLLTQQVDILVDKFYNNPGLPRCIVDSVNKRDCSIFI